MQKKLEKISRGRGKAEIQSLGRRLMMENRHWPLNSVEKIYSQIPKQAYRGKYQYSELNDEELSTQTQ